MLAALAAAVVVFALGMAGAAAFHPDHGSLARSELAWRVFGLAAYAGLAAGWLLAFAAAVRAFTALLTRRRRR